MSEGFPTPTPQQLAAEQDLLAADLADWLPREQEVGRVLYVHRDWPPPWPVWVIMFGIGLPVFAITGQSFAGNLLVYVVVVLLVAVFVLATGLSYVVLVTERAIVLTTRYFRAKTYVLPLATLNPARIRYHRNSPAMQLRTERVPEFSGFASKYRTAIYSRRAIALEGVVQVVERGDSWDPLRFAPHRPLPRERRFEFGGSRWRYFGDVQDFELSTWVFSAHRPQGVLAAIEQAVVASGRQSATGLAEWVMANPVHENRKQPLTEAEVYGAGPGPYPWFRGPEVPPDQ